MNKRCTKCNIEKTIDEYNKAGKKKNGDIKYRSDCKSCQKQRYQYNKEKILIKKKKHYEQNKDKLNEKSKKYEQENKEKILIKSKRYYQENKDKINEKHKQHYQQNKDKLNEYQKRYYQGNKEKIRIKKKQYQRYKRATDLEYKLKCNIRSRINSAIRSQLNNGATKSAHTHELLGIQMDKYIRWIEFQLKNCWTWDDWGTKFEIDHVYPIAKHDLSKKEEQFKAFNWKNTRPMCIKENGSKGAKIMPKQIFKHKVAALSFLFHERKIILNNPESICT